MSWASIDLQTTLANGLKLADPFWIASSHYTQPAMQSVWTEIEPAALTLKTTTRIDLGQATPKRVKTKTLDLVPRYGRSYYSDAPKCEEFYTYEQTAAQIAVARATLPKTKIGVSVLASEKEDFKTLKRLADQADFFELNLKYSMRVSADQRDFSKAIRDQWITTKTVITSFFSEFRDRLVFIKLPRELSWIPDTRECEELIEELKAHGKAGLVVANSLKVDIADFMHNGEEKKLRGGVLTGDVLFDGTIRLIERLAKQCAANSIPIVASGGMVDEQQILMALRAGADAVQLCTAFEYFKPGFCRTLRSALKARIFWQGLKSVSEFKDRSRNSEGIASIYSMPFMYYDAFWSEEAQREFELDIKYSDRMDAVVMSGHSLFEKWENALKARVANRKSIQFMLPDPESELFKLIQKSWGLDEREIELRQERIRSARRKLVALFTPEKKTAEDEIPGNVSWSIDYFRQCPFYSFYLFDDKVYIAQYPFLRPGKLASPVYVFFRSSHEYERVNREWEGLQQIAKQTSTGTEVIHSGN